jgi:hypothetical protein
MTLSQRYLREHGNDVDRAVRAFTSDLMRGDPATFKAGYSRANAVIAAAETFHLSRERAEELVPQRVRLIRCSDPYTRLASGAEGTVAFTDSMGTVHVKWDGGSTLGLIPGEDQWEMIA